MEKSWILWNFVERWLIALASWSWALCRISLLPLIVTFHLYGGIILLLLIFVSIAGILYKFQDVLLYFPEQPSSSRLYVPMPTGIPHENIFIRTKDGVRLNLILIRYTGDNSPYSPTIIYFHGNAGNIGHRLPNALLMLVNLKVNLLLVDYRGYGKSEGEASEEGLYLDSEAVLDYVMTRPDLDKTKIFLFGRSLGGAVAIHLASENSHRISAIMVENTFLSIPHMASTLFSFFPMRYLPLWCYKNKFLSYRKISQCRMPSLFISGLSDQLIPPVMMKQLYELSPSRTKRLAIFPDGTHNDTWQCQGYLTALEQFIREVVKSHSPEEMAKTASNIRGWVWKETGQRETFGYYYSFSRYRDNHERTAGGDDSWRPRAPVRTVRHCVPALSVTWASRTAVTTAVSGRHTNIKYTVYAVDCKLREDGHSSPIALGTELGFRKYWVNEKHALEIAKYSNYDDTDEKYM